MDQRNTRSPAALSQAFAPAQAQRLAARLASRRTLWHGSWPNRAEIEPSARGRPDRRGNRATLERHLHPWRHRRIAAAIRAAWPLTTSDARIKLRKLHPTRVG